MGIIRLHLFCLETGETERQHEMKLRYRDEGDWIDFDKEEEFQDALEILRYLQSKNPTAALPVTIALGDAKDIEVPEFEPIVEELLCVEVDSESSDSESSLSADDSDSESEDEQEPEPVAIPQEVNPEESVPEPAPFDASFIVVDQPIQEEVKEVPVEEPVPVVEEVEEEVDEEALRQSMHAMRQSYHTLLLNAPVQPVVESLPQAQFEEKPVEIPAPKVERGKFADQLLLLNDMGFSDNEKNVQLLEKHKGDMTSVIQAYLD